MLRRTLKEWKKFCHERGTSGDMVFDILSDWEEDLQQKKSKGVCKCSACNREYDGEWGISWRCSSCNS